MPVPSKHPYRVGGAVGALSFVGMAGLLDWLGRSESVITAWPRMIVLLRPLGEFALSRAGEATLLIALAAFWVVARRQDRYDASLAGLSRQARKRLQPTTLEKLLSYEYSPLVVVVLVLAIGIALWLPSRPDWSIVFIPEVPNSEIALPMQAEVTSGDKDLLAVDKRCILHRVADTNYTRIENNAVLSPEYLGRIQHGVPAAVVCSTGITGSTGVLLAELSIELEYSLANVVDRKRERRTFRLVGGGTPKQRWDLTKTNWTEPPPLD
jgi:hypothetical protein